MLAVKHLDPVLGVDIHFIITPPGAVVPIPHPHIGIVFDPFDYLPLIGATVKVNGLPRAQAGTGGRTLPPHFPIGGAFAKPPGNENETFMGSSTVVVEDEPFTYMLLPVLSCQDIGMPSPPRKKGPGAKTLLLPTSIALSIPAGPPVFVGGPPTISLMGLGMQLALGGLLKGLKKLRGLQKGSKRMEELSNRIHRKAAGVMDKLGMKSQRARDRVHKAICTLTGHPVDVVTGRVVTEMTDWELPGPIPLRLTRHYSSSLSWRDTAMGYGWNHSLDLAVWEEDGRVVYRAEDGRELEFDTRSLPRKRMPVGTQLYSSMDKLTLRRVGELRWEVEAADGLIHELRAVSGERRAGVCRVVRTHNRLGHAIVYEYGGHGRLEWVVDSVGRRVRFEHDPARRLVKTWLPHPTQTGVLLTNQYVYSTEGDLLEVHDALGYATRHAYTGHLMTHETNRIGLSFYFEYDGGGPDAWCVHTWGDGGIYDHRLRYDKRGHVTEVTDSLGHTTTHESDGRGVVVKTIDPLAAEWSYVYDEALQRTAETDPMGNTTRYEYDPRGNCTCIIQPDETTTRVEYDAWGNAVRGLDEMGGEWRWLRDPWGLLLEEINPLGHSILYEHKQGRPSSMLDPMGARVDIQYDPSLNVAHLREPTDVGMTYTHDRWGRLTQVRRSDGSIWHIQYDLRDRPVRIEEPDGEVLLFTHDAEGNLLEEQTASSRRRYTHTGFHWLASIEDAGALVRAEYDTEGRLTTLVNERGEAYRLVRDARGEVIEEHAFDGGVRVYERDALGQVVRLRRASGAVVEMEYDVVGQLTRTRYADGTQQRFTYRRDGLLTEAANEAAAVKLEYDALGRRVRESCDEHWVASRYDALGNRVELQSSGDMNALFDYDTLGRLNTIAFSVGSTSRTIQFSYDALGREDERRLPGGVTSQWRWDMLGRPLQRTVSHPRNHPEQRSYHWALGERLDAITDSLQGSLRFQHDARSRLVATHLKEGRAQLRLQDATGNLFRHTDHQDRSYSRGNRLERIEGTRLEYDADGNLIQRLLPDGSSWRYAYDGAGLLRQVLRPDGTTVCFTYDALGRRLGKQAPERTLSWIWDGDRLLHEQGAAPAPTSWLHAPDEDSPLAKIEGQAFHGILHDHLETPTAMYDEAGQVVWTASLDTYAAVRVERNESPCPWRWPGQYEDEETGLYYNRFRYYDPDAGRYISPDPTGVDGGLNLYAYVDNPLVAIDPLGLDWNYVLEDANGNVYYTGRASDNATDADVKKRHSKTVGLNGKGGPERRFDKGDKLVRITPPGVSVSKKASRGIEDMVIQNKQLNIGRRKDNGNRVRGNNIRGINPRNKRRRSYRIAAGIFLSKHRVLHCP
ncbi:hypothetical protein F0U62_45180 [Cystobacter fuscus]|nr:hypothetical protein F0U62_45180 [Cystobacter fuscus]